MARKAGTASLDMLRAAYRRCPPADTRAGLAERRRLHAEIVRVETTAGWGRGHVLDLSEGLAADLDTFLAAHADALPPDELTALRRERRRLWEERVGDWRTSGDAADLRRLARAVLDDGDWELVARILERAASLAE